MKYSVGDKAFITENNLKVRKVVVVRVSGEFCILRFLDTEQGGVTLRTSRLYKTQEEANRAINKCKRVVENSFSTFDYLG